MLRLVLKSKGLSLTSCDCPVGINCEVVSNIRAAGIMRDVYKRQGQENVNRELEVAAAGGHNLIMIGAPGSGKSMMAKRLPSILSTRKRVQPCRFHPMNTRCCRAVGIPGERS